MNQEHAKQLCLKHAYGGSLTEIEGQIVKAFRETQEGQDYMTRSLEMKDVLTDIADVTIKPVDKSEMIKRFEASVRENAQKASKTVPKAFGPLLVVFVMMASTSLWETGFSQNSIFLIGLTGMFGVLCWVLVKHSKQMLTEKNIYQQQMKARQQLKTTKNKLVNLLIFAPIIALFAWHYFQNHGWEGTVIFVIGWAALTWLMITYFQKRNRKQDPELYDWWKDEISD